MSSIARPESARLWRGPRRVQGRTLRHFAGFPGASCKIGQMLAKLRAHFHQ
jgi:hypothetical protein